jgi:nucleotide-binding universal stress UspA family protein
MAYPFHAILCPVGFNGNYAGALSMARRLEIEPGSTICLLHVIPSLPPRREGVFVDVSLEEGARDEAARRRLEKIAREQLAGTNYKILVGNCEAPDHIAESIIKTAQQTGTDLVVMATHGRVGLPHELFGSITERVVRQSRCPVLTVPLEG